MDWEEEPEQTRVSKLLDELDRVISTCDPSELPLLVGRMERGKLIAQTRMAAAITVPAEEKGSEDDEVLPMREVARILGKHVDTTYQMARDGELPIVRLGKRLIGVRRGALRDVIRKRERQTIK